MIIRYLLQHPIGALAAFICLMVVGVYSWIMIPVNLMPNVAAPKITIEVKKNGATPEILEKSIVTLIRQSMVGAYGLEGITSEAIPGFGRVSLDYEFGTNMDIARIEVNEKIDRLMSRLPIDTDRPIVRKTKPGDIPVVYIHLSSKVIPLGELSQLIRFEFVKRFEQLDGAAQILTSGSVRKAIGLTPKSDKILATGLTLSDISNQIRNANLPLGQILIHDGSYEYMVTIENILNDQDDMKTLLIQSVAGLLIPLHELFNITEFYSSPYNHHYYNDKRGVVIAIYSQPRADLIDLHNKIVHLLDNLKKEYAQIDFNYSQDQAILLKENINNLYITILAAIVLAFLIFIISSKGIKLPLTLFLIIPSSIIVSIGVIYFLDLTLNIITLSSFILGTGLLVDNVIVLIEEINQHLKSGLSKEDACIIGIGNIAPALLTSMLTTICVFIPLIGMGGIVRELFSEQAITLFAILLVSLLLSFTLLPILYVHLVKERLTDRSWVLNLLSYKGKLNPIYRNMFVSVLLVAGIYAINTIESEQLPKYTAADYLVKIIWNEPLSLAENNIRTKKLLVASKADFISYDLGIKGYIEDDISYHDGAYLYVKARNAKEAEESKKNLSDLCKILYPQSSIELLKSKNPFEIVFHNDQPLAEARIRRSDGNLFNLTEIERLQSLVKDGSTNININEAYQIRLNQERILNSSIDFEVLLEHLKELTHEHKITEIAQSDENIPVLVKDEPNNHYLIIDGSYHDLSTFYDLVDITQAKSITGDQSGVYISYKTNSLEDALLYGKEVSNSNGWLYDVHGSLKDNRKTLSKIVFGGLLGIMLLYLILTIQFESFVQPLIILSIVPLSIMGSLIGLLLFDATLNIMSLLGFILTIGIIINDSILKIDAINRNLLCEMDIKSALAKAKKERLKPILMTSLSTVLAMLPILLFDGIASDLQRPFAIVIIFGLSVGTWSSIVLLPIFYTKFKKYVPKSSK